MKEITITTGFLDPNTGLYGESKFDLKSYDITNNGELIVETVNLNTIVFASGMWRYFSILSKKS